MKLLFILGIITFGLCSCSKEDVDIIPKDVEFSIDYAFAETGNMTRATGAEVYGDFYDKNIKNKKLTPKTYTLSFTNSNGVEILKVSGKWGDKKLVRLPSGNYTVSGISHPIVGNYQSIPSDSVYMKFEENITIKENMTELVLPAKYDSYLLLFDKSNMDSIKLKGFYSRLDISKVHTISLYSNDDIYWAFINKDSFYFKEDNNSYYPYSSLVLTINRKDGTPVMVYISRLKFELGKYYYFNDMTNSFDIPPMESGN